MCLQDVGPLFLPSVYLSKPPHHRAMILSHGAYEEHRVGSLWEAEIQAGIEVLRSGLAEGHGTGYVSQTLHRFTFHRLPVSLPSTCKSHDGQ